MPWCSSQEKYPRKYQQGSDTLIIITPEQLAGANSLFQKKNLLESRTGMLESVIEVQDSIINIRILEVSMLWQMNENYRLQITKMQQLQDTEKTLHEQDKRKLRRTCWIVGGVCLSVGVSAGILIMALK